MLLRDTEKRVEFMESNELLQELIKLVEQAAPQLWQIAIRQVYVEVIKNMLIFLFLVTLIILLIKVYKKVESYKLDLELKAVVIFVVVVLCGFLIFNLYAIIARLINPQFYAIELLLSYVRG